MGRFLGEATSRVADLRRRRPSLDHLVLMQEHYSSVRGSHRAGAVTYYAFLSFFPLLALAVFVVGWISEVYPDANTDLVAAVNAVVPGVVGPGEHQISLDDIRTFSGWAGVAGLAGVLYAGLRWLSVLRAALLAVFAVPAREQPGFVTAQLRDLLTLVVLGTVLFLSVVVAGFVRGFASDLLSWAGLAAELAGPVEVVSVLFGLGANVVLFFAMFRLLAAPSLPVRQLWSGALLGGIAFELLKQLSGQLLGYTRDQAAFQAFGIALILLLWINYTSRIILYAASWAWTSAARSPALDGPSEPVGTVQGGRAQPPAEAVAVSAPVRPNRVASFVAGAAVASGLLHLIHRRKDM